MHASRRRLNRREVLHGKRLELLQACAPLRVILQAAEDDARPCALAVEHLRRGRELRQLCTVQLLRLQERVDVITVEVGGEAVREDHLQADDADAPDVEGRAGDKARRVEHLRGDIC